MKKFSLIIILTLSFFVGKTQSLDSLTINYYENFPYAYLESGKLRGIEIDIIEEYVNWLKAKKGITLVLNYKPYNEFSAFYNSVKNGSSKIIGLGSVTTNADREKEVSISAPYLQNVAVLITAGKVHTVKEKNQTEVTKVFSGLNAMVVNNSSHMVYMNSIKRTFIPNLKIESTESQNKVLEKISNDHTFFGYVDIVAYWAYLKNNPSKFLKIQKVFNEPKEYLGFIMPKESLYKSSLNEFFESGFGFTSTKSYHQILEKYLGYEIIESVEIK
ncbi:substrate-binding periplasmic protein [Aurantibacillus circumpalustris]|uniref:substrate-binding periplasmic protein n=1 Tax=Aurantibacillus circumpalustris TaxID=3036359 RepID=UPI00295AC2C2|nr:transporter substrate-binding domain-containing protein [Aurantibacillus circumpalustris]